jgi:hypothetical protein
MNQDLIFDLLNRALNEELGLAIETNNPKQLVENIHRATKGLSRYDSLIVTIPSTLNTVFIVKRSVELDEDPNG